MTLDTSRPLSESISVVLVHGAFVDASGWRKVYEILSQDGYEVLVVQNSAVTISQDVERTKGVIAEASHPVVLVGHSYGGAVITEAGIEEKVLSLVYLAAFVPDAGESVFDLASKRSLVWRKPHSFRRRTASSKSIHKSLRPHSRPT
jgi:pimeloyl-ACP methyl ester carboxylesterase